MNEAAAGGRIFFSHVRRSLEFEDEIRLISVGVDIGSSTSHLVFSRLLLERLDSRYVISERTDPKATVSWAASWATKANSQAVHAVDRPVKER